MRAVIIGGGVIGTFHARQALKAGFDVIHLERDPLPASASVRNFGLVWVGGRKSGDELESAIRARQLWGEAAEEMEGLTFRPNGSLTVVRNQAELKVIQESLLKSDAGLRQWEILDKKDTQKLNPPLRGDYIAALWCPLDAVVEPGQLLTSIRASLLQNSKYIWRSKVEIIEVIPSDGGVLAISESGEGFGADIAIICPGADHTTLFREQLQSAPLRQVYLQMMSTAPLDEQLTTSIADADSLRYYPAYDVSALQDLPPQPQIAAENHMQLLLVQRSDGTLTIGDTHAYQTPFDFKLHEAPYEYLHNLASEILGKRIPPIVDRWSGIYSQRTDGAVCDRRYIAPNIVVVTGLGGRGNSLAPEIAETTLKGFVE